MIISVCIPCMNRTYDLREIMPSLIDAANHSPPVEIVILDYNSQDDLAEYITDVKKTVTFTNGSMLSYKKYIGRDYYHMAHARNLSVLASVGEYIVISCADVCLPEDYFERIRTAWHEGIMWTKHNHRYVGIVGMWREEFLDAGGFDERFEFYGKEDKDLIARLERRGDAGKMLSSRGMKILSTPKEDKYKNYRLVLPRSKIAKRAKRIYERNIRNKVLVANENKEWGKWD